MKLCATGQPAAGPFSPSSLGPNELAVPYRPTVISDIRPRSSALTLMDRDLSVDVLKVGILHLPGSKNWQQQRTTHSTSPPPTAAMDYGYFSAPQHSHHFVGMSPHGFPHTGVESDTISSVVRVPTGVVLRLASPRTSALSYESFTNLNTTGTAQLFHFPSLRCIRIARSTHTTARITQRHSTTHTYACR